MSWGSPSTGGDAQSLPNNPTHFRLILCLSNGHLWEKSASQEPATQREGGSTLGYWKELSCPQPLTPGGHMQPGWPPTISF